MDSQDNVDARAALGVKPGQRPGRLRLQIDSALHPLSLSSNRTGSRSNSPKSPKSPKIGGLLRGSSPNRRRSSSVGEATSPRTSTSKEAFKRVRRHTLSRKNKATGLTANRGQYETQKLLSHLLDRLEARPSAPDLLDRAAFDARKASGKATGKGKRSVVHIGEVIASAAHPSSKGHHQPNGSTKHPPEAEAENYHFVNEGEWYTNEACDLVEQMRDLLILADKQHMDIFGASQLAAAEAGSTAQQKRRGSVFSPAGLIPRSKDTDFDRTVTVSGPCLLKRLMEMIRSLLTVDCIHAAVRFSPLRPPYALQALCLDVAALLYNEGDLDTECAILDAVTVSLYSVGDKLCERVCQWLEGRLREHLDKLAEDRGGDFGSPAVEWNDPFAPPSAASPAVEAPSVPTFAFSEDPEEPPTQNPNLSKGSSGWMRFSPTTQTRARPWERNISGILSTLDISGQLSPEAQQLAAIVPRILVAVTSTIDLNNANLGTIYRVHRLLSLILTAKPDASLDLLEIIALGPLPSRRQGMNILTTFFPEATGHNVIARRPALATYNHHRVKWETGQDRVLAEDDTEGHSWMPWKADNTHQRTCYSCHQQCTGFCVRCSLCGDIKHVGCLRLYRDELFECHVTDTGTGSKETSRMRFSKRVCRVDELVLNEGPTRGTSQATTRKVGKHRLHMVNLFTITLCAECEEPLWGAAAQGYACMGLCQQFYHPACVDMMANRALTTGSNAGLCLPGFDIHVNLLGPTGRDRFTISANDLKSSFEQSASMLYHEPSQLSSLSYDEVTLLYAQLWIQREVFANGLASGSLKMVGHDGTGDPTGLEELLSAYKDYLDTATLHPSSAIVNFCRGESVFPDGYHDWLWRPRYLQYCASLLRSPSTSSLNRFPEQSTSGLLTVEGPFDSLAEEEPDSPIPSYEVLDMQTVRQTLAVDFQLRDPLAAPIFLEQLRSLGYCGVPLCETVRSSALQNDSLTVTFPIPQLMDSSPAVELLVLTIEQLLDDVDLLANEQGLNLLYYRAWPSTMCSPFALERLGAAVISWVMAEDDVLHHIVKNYASKGIRPPGVRSIAKDATSVTSYKDDRGMLLMRYAHAWLRALHDLDLEQYVNLAYERSKVMDDRWEVIDLATGDDAGPQAAAFAMERLTTLADADVSFSVTLDLLVAWLDDVGGIAHEDTVYKSLPRLLRHTGSGLGTQGSLWELSQATSAEGAHGLQRVCRWLRVMACSGVEVPWLALKELLEPAMMESTSDEARYDLVTAIHVNAMAIDPEEYATLCNVVLTGIISSIISKANQAGDHHQPSEVEKEILITCMTMVLRAYGTLVEELQETALYTDHQTKLALIHSKRKAHFLARYVLIPLSVDTVVAAANLLQRPEYPAPMTLDFLWLLFAKTPSADNVHSFLHHVCPELYEAIWPLYDQGVDRRSRARVLLKLLTINAIPIERMVGRQADAERAVARERLLTFIFDMADKHVTRDVSGWERSSTGLILILFNKVLDPSIPDPENLVVWRALLPAQLNAISQCFESYLLFGSDEQRLALLAQLSQLQRLHPSWPIISWDAIEQIVAEQFTIIQQFQKSDTLQALAAMSDAWTIRATTLAIGLHMLAAGVPCEWKVIQRFQQHVASACARPWPTPADAITGILLPALKQVLDSTTRVSMKNVAEDDEKQRKKTFLVGSQFVLVVISFATDLSQWDFMVQRYILDILLVVFFKHNLQPVELPVLESLQTLGLYALKCPSSQNAIMALQVLRTAQQRVKADRLSRVLPQLFVLVSDILVHAMDHDGDSVLIESARTFLQESLQEFGKSGLVLQVLRVDGLPMERKRAPNALARALPAAVSGSADHPTSWLDLLFHDLSEIHRWNRERMGQVLVSLNRLTSVRKEPISEENALAFGNFLSRLGKHAAEWDAGTFDANPVLQVSAVLLNLSPPESAGVLLHQIATFLNLALSRFGIKLISLNDLVVVSTRVARNQQTDNTVLMGILELLTSGLSGHHILPMTMRSLLQFLSGREGPNPPVVSLDDERDKVAVHASMKCLSILVRSHPSVSVTAGDSDATMNLLDAAAAVVVRAELASPGNIGHVLHALPSEAAIVQLNVLSHVLYASLNMSLGPVRNHLVTLYPIMARATAQSMFACSNLLSAADPNNDGAFLATSVYTATRLSILAARNQQDTEAPQTTEEALAGFWRRIWPDWERLLMLAISPSCINTPLLTIVLSVLEDMVIFVSQTSPNLLVEPAPLIARGLRAIEEFHTSAGKTPTAKLAKAHTALDTVAFRPTTQAPTSKSTAPPPNRTHLAKTIWTDMLTTERLLAAAERKRDSREPRERAPTRVAFR